MYWKLPKQTLIFVVQHPEQQHHPHQQQIQQQQQHIKILQEIIFNDLGVNFLAVGLRKFFYIATLFNQKVILGKF